MTLSITVCTALSRVGRGSRLLAGLAVLMPAILLALPLPVAAAVITPHGLAPDTAASDTAASVSPATETAASDQAQSAVAERVARAIRHEIAEKDLPAFSIALVSGDTVSWQAGFGWQDEEQTVPATAETVYRVGSVSKLFTDIAVMQLADEGAINPDAPVADVLPGFQPQPDGGRITLRQLMSHLSGLVREPPVGHYFDPTRPSLDATVASLNQTSLIYEPGTRVKYSNAGIAVAGAVVEAVRGRPYDAVIDERILTPLQMSSSSFRRTPQLQQRLATGWMWTYDGRRFVAPVWPLGTAPAGNLYSSVSDLSQFLKWLLADSPPADPSILSSESLQDMLTPVRNAAGEPQNFGLGFHLSELDGLRQVGHGGAVYGFSTQVEALPDRRLGVAAVCALDGSNGLVRRIADYALRCLLAEHDGQPLPEYETTVAVPAERVGELRGRWTSDASGAGDAEITELNGRVLLRYRGQMRELRARSRDGVIVMDDVFGFGPTVRRQDDGRLAIGERSLRSAPDQPPADIPADWQGLVGEYGPDHNTLYILEDHGRLTALIEWFYFDALDPAGPDTFAFPDRSLYHGETLRFVRDERGIATRVIAAGVEFVRRDVGTTSGETFRITPLRPVSDLRSAAAEATPPEENGEFREPDLVEIGSLDDTIRRDIRYAGTNNFMGARFYRQPRAFLQRPAAEALVRVHQSLRDEGLGLLIHDAYRPWYVTKMFWDATPDAMKDFVANPARGSRHNRGCAVDLTLFDLATGNPVPMVAGYDEFSARSFPLYPGGTSRQRWYRDRLRRAMEAEGFTVYEFEWWHFDYRDWRRYRIQNRTFEELLSDDAAAALPVPGDFTIERTELPVVMDGQRRAYDGKRCWVHARAGVVREADDSVRQVVLTTQPLLLTGSDVFYALHSTVTADRGQTWSELEEQSPFRRRRIDERTEITVCDFVPQWHAASKTLLGTGQTVRYHDNRVMKVRPRSTAWATWDAEARRWSAWQPLEMPAEPQFQNCGAGSVQRLDLDNGDILLPVSFKRPEDGRFSVTVCRCEFDGSELRYREHGSVHTIPVKRGLYEPSLTRVGDRYLLTLRNDDHGYVTAGDDGLNFDEPRRWTFDDGTDLGNYNTQQHWVTHGDQVYLTYTRRGADNDHVFRHRAPLFIAEVDPQRLVVLRDTERILVPERGARLGNFGVTPAGPDEVWVTVTEWMQAPPPQRIIPVDNPRGASNAIHIVRLRWPAAGDADPSQRPVSRD